VIDGARLLDDLEELARVGATREGGVTRIAYSDTDGAGRRVVSGWLEELGLAVRTDEAGNVIGRLAGVDPALPPIALGSHTDTVPEGGRFDGALGVVAAVACARALVTGSHRLRHPLEVIDFACEEATMAGGTLGSRAMAGQWDAAIAGAAAWDGRPVREHLLAAGLEPGRVGDAARPPRSLAAYVELHIEQGATLEQDEVDIGVVTGIVGIRRYAVTFEGEANHAGTTPMDRRRDALVAAAPFVLQVRDAAVEHGIVGTVGSLTVHPGASNVIPGKVEMTAEIRGLDDGVLDAVEAELSRVADLKPVSRKEPVACSRPLLEALESACNRLELTHRRMPSGAGHDAMCIAALAPVAMLFVPSRGGVSHSSLEFTKPEHCVNGARVMLAALLDLDGGDILGA
jgi:N-carbamoyl-L-amino-acid hydrolase